MHDPFSHLRVARFRTAVKFGAVLGALSLPHPAHAQPPAATDSFTLFKYQRPIGRETYTVRDSAGHHFLATSSRLSFLGGSVPLTAALHLAPDGSPVRFEAKGATSTMTDVDLLVTRDGDDARVAVRGASATRRVIPGSFPMHHYPALAVEEALFRFWRRRGRPGRVALLPEGSVRFTPRGTDRFTLRGRPVGLQRYLVDGVIWGRQTAWFDAQDRLIAVVGADAELDRFEAIRDGFEPLLPQLVQRAVHDALATAANAAQNAAPASPATLAIVGVRIVDGTGAPAVEDATIVVRGGRITAVGPRASTAVPRNARVIAGAGHTVIPGLWDMHVHYTQPEWLPAGLAAGVTTARDAANEIELITALRDAVASGRAVGPRLLLAGVVDGGEHALGIITADTPAEARRAVDRYHRAGFQQIKIYESLTPALVPVIVEEAHRRGMTVTGHVPTGMTLLEFVRAGVDQVNHLNYVQAALRAPSPPGQPVRAVDLASEPAQAALAVLRERGIVIEPSLARREQRAHAKDSTFAHYEPGVVLAPPALREVLEATGVAGEAAGRIAPATERYYRLFAELHRAGIRSMLGTDLVVPGHTMHRELELAVRGGLTPLEAIHLATLAPARAMTLDATSGSIAVGKRADLVVVEGRPDVDISDVRRVRHVIAGGKLHDPAALWRAAGFEPPLPEPVGDGAISTPEANENFPAIDPIDGSLWYSRYAGEQFNDQRLVRAARTADGWGTPQVVPFAAADTFGARAPRFTPDGLQLYVTTWRPRAAGEQRNMDVWVADRIPSGWTAFRRVPEPVSTNGFELHPSLTRDAMCLPARRDGGRGQSDIYRVQRAGSGWSAEAVHLPPPINDARSQPDLYVAPDESYMILAVTIRRDSTEDDDLFYSARTKDGWTTPRALPGTVNTRGYEYGPWVGADGMLYFNSDRRGSADLYRISLRALGIEGQSRPRSEAGPRGGSPPEPRRAGATQPPPDQH